ncbi:hypothetical protein SCHPADRAFT_636585 [Schizopora paradoxa]|uniref:Uncharacterized protein n=1 Tax=Schizopora paradoxa TaxID=27342 RepID=A0A0H2R7C2_9AGAM|nr:hypothetical protein SCHPADRAFT_636585 [Schizopora paradoxa]
MLGVIHPYHQWREIHFNVINEDHAHQYFEHDQASFHSLEHLAICNDHAEALDDEGVPVDYLFSIYLGEGHSNFLSNFLSSWRMLALTHLRVRNCLPCSLCDART